MTLKKDTGFGSYPLQYAALGLLMPGPKHGYGLYQDFVTCFDKIWSAGQTNFYLALAECEKRDLVSVTTEPQEARPVRKVYDLTPAGRDAFLKWLHLPVRSMRAMRVELVGKLRFFTLLGVPGADALIEAQAALLEAMIEEWAQDSGLTADPFHSLVIDFRVRQAEAIVDWLEVVRESLVME